jgi:hypothetical protein
MSPKSKKEYTAALRARYKKATKGEKKSMLNEFCAVCGYNRKYAIRLLKSKPPPSDPSGFSKRGRKKIYAHPLILKTIRNIWVTTNLPCSKRLKVILPLWLPYYPNEIPSEVYDSLLNISPATIDRLMKPDRAKFSKHGLGTTKPGTLLKKQIPIKTNQWNEFIPGFLEADAVAHCGQSTAGMFAYTINCVDIATTWTEQRAVWGRGEQGVVNAIDNIENSLPFPLKGFDCDNGSEFLNWHLYKHFIQRKKPVQFTRSRPYYKNDNAHVEEKNWTNIRQYLGYERFDKIELVEKLNDLYTTEWPLYFNFFIPSVKLMAKYRLRSKVIKKYDQPKTPLQRVLESEEIDQKTKTMLTRQFEKSNPFDLQKRMAVKIKAIIKDAKE